VTVEEMDVDVTTPRETRSQSAGKKPSGGAAKERHPDSGLRRSARLKEQATPASAVSRDSLPENMWVQRARMSSLKNILTVEVKLLQKRFKVIRHGEIKSDCPLHQKLKDYHDQLQKTLPSIATPKITLEMAQVVEDISLIDIENRAYKFSKEDEKRLNDLNVQVKLLTPPAWPWGAADESAQGRLNDARMDLWKKEQCQFKLLTCGKCGVTVPLVGLEQMNCKMCPDCLAVSRMKPSLKQEYEEAWETVRPKENHPKSVTPGFEGTSLPELTPAEKAIIAIIHPVVTVRRNQLGVREFKQESITLLNNPENTWAKFLPRISLKDRYIILERKSDQKPSR
jgi:hypothetical protein